MAAHTSESASPNPLSLIGPVQHIGVQILGVQVGQRTVEGLGHWVVRVAEAS